MKRKNGVLFQYPKVDDVAKTPENDVETILKIQKNEKMTAQQAVYYSTFL